MALTNRAFIDNTFGSGLTVIRMREDQYSMRDEILAGLRMVPKTIHPKYLYDMRGSQLFERICMTPEYYLTRAEHWILHRWANEIIDKLGEGLCIIEPGAGACRKIRPLLETGAVSMFIPVDISAKHLRTAAAGVSLAFPDVTVRAVSMDYLHDFNRVQNLLPQTGRRVIFYPGSSIGNFDPPVAQNLMRQFGSLLKEDDALLMGFDVQKDADIIRSAYNDNAGATAAFNLNILSHLNRELRAEFDPNTFTHIAFYNEIRERVEMHLESIISQRIKIAGETVEFDKYERVHTENSYKYSVGEFNALAADAGFYAVNRWSDARSLFAVGLYRKSPVARKASARQAGSL